MADTVHELTFRTLSELAEERLARRAIRATRFYLNELMVMQSPLSLAGHTLGETGVADLDDRLERMGLASQEAALMVRQWHCGKL